jgi:hypothetical protein
MNPPQPPNPNTQSYLERANKAEAARRAADKRTILNPAERRSRQVAMTLTEGEVEVLQRVAREARMSMSDWLRTAMALVLDAKLDLSQGAQLAKPATIGRLERQAKAQASRKGATPDPKALPRHCERAMTLVGGVMLECPVCGLTLLKDAQ